MNIGASWPERETAGARVLAMQTKLHRWAGADPCRCFDDLFNLVYDPAFLVTAWHLVRGNKGGRAAGIDGIAPNSIDSPAAFLAELRDTLKAALRSYAERRDAHLGSHCGPHFFVAGRGGRLLHQYVHRVFWRLSHEIGLRRAGEHTGPRIHDFRHRFAIQTLLGWYRDGLEVEQRLPLLSTYLGHTCVRDTYWYLSACPQLMEEAARRLDRLWEAKS